MFFLIVLIEIMSFNNTTDTINSSSSGGGVSDGGKQIAMGKGLSSKASLQKLASSFAALNKRKAEKRQNNSWHLLIKDALNSQRGKIPLLLAVEAGNQSMCRELLSSQTAEQLKVSVIYLFHLSYLFLDYNQG